MTELSYAYGPLGGPSSEPSMFEDEIPPSKPIAVAPPAVSTKSVQPTLQQSLQQTLPQVPTPVQPFQANDQEQKLLNILSEIKKQQKSTTQEAPSYIDKLYAKRKELWKALQICFIIILALSLHFFIDHYLKLYINNNDLSFEREVFVRLLYPLGILFLLWNLKTFVK